MIARARGFLFLVTTAVLILGVALAPRAASADPSMAVHRDGAAEGYTGVVRHTGYLNAEGVYVHDIFFELPDAVARDITFGSVIVPDDPSYQSLIVVEPHVGYCINYGLHGPTPETRYHFHGTHMDNIARRALDARRRGMLAAQIVWALRGTWVDDP